MNIFVAKLSRSTTSGDLQELFERYGEVSSSKVVIDRETGNSKGYGFVEMPDDSEAREAISDLNETNFDDSEIVVKEARPKEARTGGGGGGFNRGGGNRGGGFNRDRPNSNYNRY
jgi:RNA recognition motif-containing protein